MFQDYKPGLLSIIVVNRRLTEEKEESERREVVDTEAAKPFIEPLAATMQ